MSRPKPETESPGGPIGLLGGTFDPIHFGHLRLAEEAREALDLARLTLIPAGQPPHRDAPATAPEHRLAMVRAAIAGNAALDVDDGEIRAAGASYTVLTLERLRQRYGNAQPLVLILGADAFQGLPSWHRWTDLLEFAHIAVANRPGYAENAPKHLPAPLASATQGRFTRDPQALRSAPAGRILPFEITPLAISASLVRERLAAGRSTRYLLPDSVLDYIGLHHLYRRN